MEQWYVCVAGGDAVGPVTTEFLELGIRSGKVPEDAFVCPVGGPTWRRIVDVPTLAPALPGPAAFLGEQVAGRYSVRAKIGEGGMGEVHLSSDAWIARDVALKVMRREQATVDSARARFIREARIQGQLEHPSIVPVYDIGMRPDGTAYFTMKRVKGETLHVILHALKSGHEPTIALYSRRRLLAAMSQVAAAVGFAHSRGIIHRDLKPDNVMLGDFGEVYVLDWGVAKVLEDSWAGTAAPAGIEAPSGRTLAGAMVGTPGYASPEQVRGDVMSVGPRSDVYSLGAILFEILALEPLHAGKTNEDLYASTLAPGNRRPSERRSGIPPELDAICAKAIARDSSERFASALELHAALERCLDGERNAEHRRDLAREHVAAAERAFEAAAKGGEGAEAQRVTGMRELGAAIALEPTNEEASQTLLRVLLHGPDELPPAAEEALHKVDLEDRADGARFGILYYLATLLPAPVLLSLHVRRPIVGMLLIASLFVTVGLQAWVWRFKKAERHHMVWPIVASFIFCAIQTTFFGPLIVAPGAAAATAAIFLVSIRANQFARRALLGLALGSIFFPLALELAGVLPRSYSISAGKLIIEPNLFSFDETTSFIILSTSAALTIALTVLGVGRAVESLVQAERRNFAQAFRLRQILPGLQGGPRT